MKFIRVQSMYTMTTMYYMYMILVSIQAVVKGLESKI
jgi:hypothetical protein